MRVLVLLALVAACSPPAESVVTWPLAKPLEECHQAIRRKRPQTRFLVAWPPSARERPVWELHLRWRPDVLLSYSGDADRRYDRGYDGRFGACTCKVCQRLATWIPWRCVWELRGGRWFLNSAYLSDLGDGGGPCSHEP